MKNKKLIFIGGLHRSGTSLVHEILREHPKISGFKNTGIYGDEGQHLQSIYPSAKYFGGPGRFGFDERSFMDDSHTLVSAANAEKIFNEWSRYWNMQYDYLIEKSPPNLVRTRFLQGMFDNSIFIILFRHPIAVSYATKKWSKTSIQSLLEHYFVCYERFLSDLPFIDKCFILRYEDFVLKPQETIDKIFQFIGIDSLLLNRTVNRDVNKKYLELCKKDNASWLFRFFKKKIPISLERRANRFGYSLENPEELIPVEFLDAYGIESLY